MPTLKKGKHVWGPPARGSLCWEWEGCHGMTELVKLVKVHRKDQSVNKNAILASFVCFFNFPDRNLIILYKIA